MAYRQGDLRQAEYLEAQYTAEKNFFDAVNGVAETALWAATIQSTATYHSDDGSSGAITTVTAAG